MFICKSTISLDHKIDPRLGPGASGTSDTSLYYDMESHSWYLLSTPFTSNEFPNYTHIIGLGVVAISPNGTLTWIGGSYETRRQQRPAHTMLHK